MAFLKWADHVILKSKFGGAGFFNLATTVFLEVIQAKYEY